MNRAQALEILKDPAATEDEWLRALEILDNRVPLLPTFIRPKPGTYMRRLGIMTGVYTCAFLIINSVGRFYHPYMHDYSILECVLFAFGWATMEIYVGLVSLLSLIGLIGGVLKLSSNDPTWLLLLINLFIFFKLGWKPILLNQILGIVHFGKSLYLQKTSIKLPPRSLIN